MSIDTVVFDLGEVMIHWNPRNLYRKIFADEEEMEYFLSHVCNSAWNHQQDAGRSFAEGIAEASQRFPQYTSEIRAYWDRWEETLGEVITGTVGIQQQLLAQGQHRVIALTNWSQETFPIAFQKYSFLHDFQAILVSGKVGLAKPDPAIYQMLFKDFQVNPARAVFIDDSLANVEAARKEGMRSLHFQSPERLKEELHNLGIHLDALAF